MIVGALLIYLAIGVYHARRISQKFEFDDDDYLLATLIVVLWGIPAIFKTIKFVSTGVSKLVLWKPKNHIRRS